MPTDSKPGEESMLARLNDTLRHTVPGTLWFSQDDLENLGDLLSSMTQYRPSNRPSAAEVLRHPWFRHRPSLAPVHGPWKEQK